MNLIIYMPALNEADNIQQVIARLPRKLKGIGTIQYLVIDDGSTDATAEIALANGAQVVRHGRNRGVGAAFHSAVQFALENHADILIGMDADGQFNPADIPAMIEPILKKRADMVMGNRFASGMPEHMPRAKYWGNQKVAQLIHYVSRQKFQDVSCGFRAYSREALFRMNIFAEFTYTHETILSLVFQGLQVEERSIWIKYFPERKSRVAASISNYAVQTSRIILRVMLDYQPLRIFGTLGSICLVIGSGFIIFLMGYFALTGSFTPYKNTGFIGLGFIVFGMLVLLIALIADMLNRVRLNQDKLLYELKKSKYKE
ncbi:MAG: glycosyltransferase family 2 protein [Anaerolineales bacterium]|nr:glycosyltransferase family 2 protein [Anaerolineales bacterium]MBP6208643.1 glycosyltransferase family 2 protein [Anaerolineales bacterium]